jgi:gamma-glutamyltranspeptidase / glutathione hydrolase / leukotriene-C4 hydrolase
MVSKVMPAFLTAWCSKFGILVAMMGLFSIIISTVAVMVFWSSWQTEIRLHGFPHGAVAADNSDCSRIGAEVLTLGGNAVDAIVTTALCQGVTHPFASGMGGGGFLMYHNGETSVVIDFREEAPACATEDMFEDNVEASEIGGLAVGIPGELKGLHHAHSLYGNLSWEAVVRPVQELAEKGFIVSEAFMDRYSNNIEKLKNNAGLKKVFFQENGDRIQSGSRMYRKDLAATLARIAKEGPSALYEGPLAEDIISTIQSNGGCLTLEDLASYQPIVREPYRTFYVGKEVLVAPPPASGAVLGFILNYMESVLHGTGTGVKEEEETDLSETFTWDIWNHPAPGPSIFPMGEEGAYAFAEAMKFGFAGRGELGDPVVHPQVNPLAEQMAQDKRMASHSRHNTNWHHTMTPDNYGTQFVGPSNHGTTHMSVMDGQGGAAALTTTVNFSFGSGLLAPASGIVLNDQMNDFSVSTKVANGFGLAPSPMNRPQPGARPLSSMCPTLVLDDGLPYLAVGASGGPTIISSVSATVIHALQYNASAALAVGLPRMHHQLIPNQIRVERHFPGSIQRYLESKGHVVDEAQVLADGHLLGVVQMVKKTFSGYQGASDPRKHGEAAGY